RTRYGRGTSSFALETGNVVFPLRAVVSFQWRRARRPPCETDEGYADHTRKFSSHQNSFLWFEL
ncbi:hypothetical protein Tsubulata_011629, partial [Turnera subulata]